MISLILTTIGTTLLKLIVIFLTAIPAGAGLGIGLYYVKQFFSKREGRKVADKHSDRIDEFTQMEKDPC